MRVLFGYKGKKWGLVLRALWHYNRQQADDFAEAIEWAELAIDMG